MRYPATLRMIVVTVVSAALVASLQQPVQAHHRRTAWCSKTGDICQSVRKVDGARKLRIQLAAKYFSRYALCVKDPSDLETCLDFKIRELESEAYGSSVKWAKRFGRAGKGRYVVTWYRVPRYGPPTKRIGEVLRFHVR